MGNPNDLRSPALAGIVAHHAARESRVVLVPEWAVDGQPLAIHVTPMTLAEQQRIREAGQREGDAARLVQVLITKARDGEGKPLFTVADKVTLLTSCDPDVLARVVIEMLAETRSVEAHVKN